MFVLTRRSSPLTGPHPMTAPRTLPHPDAWPRPPACLTASRLGEPPEGARIAVAGARARGGVRQRPIRLGRIGSP